MASELKDKIDEGYTEFGGPVSRQVSYLRPTGVLGRFFAKFMPSKGQLTTAQSLEGGDPTPQHPLAGDTVINTDVISLPDLERSNHIILPELERARRDRYKEYEGMDEYPEIGSAFDIFADEMTQQNLEGEKWDIETSDPLVREEIKNLFDTIDLEYFIWDICRNTVKYGDCFVEIILDLDNPTAGLQRIKILNPSFIIRVENEYGYLVAFLQEIPEKADWDAYGMQSLNMKGKNYVYLDKNQIVHSRLHTSDPSFYPYGRSVAALASKTWRSLKLMEDAMLIYRLERAPEKLAFYIDVGQLPATKAEMFIERIKQKFKKEKYYDPIRGAINERYNPLSFSENFYLPMRGGVGTKIETIPGAQNLGDVDDVKYFRDKLLAAMKIPKDYVVEKENSPDRKANLSQLDVKFARVIMRMQKNVELGLESIAKRHLKLKEYPKSAIDELKIRLPEPSDVFVKRKLEIEEQKVRVIQGYIGLKILPMRMIYKEYFNMNDLEIDELEKELEEDLQKEVEKQAMLGMADPGGFGEPPPGGDNNTEVIANKQPGSEGIESAENKSPAEKAQESIKTLEILYQKILTEEGASLRLNQIRELIIKRKVQLSQITENKVKISDI